MESLLKGSWPWYITGILFGLIVPLLLIVGNKPFGISKSLKDIASLLPQKRFKQLRHDLTHNVWRLYLILGIIIGGFLAVVFLNGNATIDLSMATISDLEDVGITNFDGLVPSQIFNWEFLLSAQGLLIIVLGGFLIGFGVRYANGCTSGHAIMGLSIFSSSSLIAVLGFFAGGLLMTHILFPLVFTL
ncbi:MAG: YeeE/YedE family protein [Flavobacteriales bacterium]|nr:YeeE/YedE family protein [Flavobacteriales bacterium]|tara:strand:+ start:605 stop:1168 length:564 start_codon:yes stop_codon:yes gene_type:complete